MNGKCCLCGQNCDAFAKSHLIPSGFSSRGKYAHQMSLMAEGHMPKRLRDGVYDCRIFCQDCEHRYFQDPDDYGIKIYRDFKWAEHNEVLASNGQVGRWWLFPDVNRYLLRAFIASVLWRCSVSSQDGVRDFKLGDYYEDRIADDLKHGGRFEYVDAVAIVFEASNLPEAIQGVNESLILPQKVILKHNGNEANGFDLWLPRLHFRISLDCRPNPYAIMPDGMYDPMGICTGNSPSIASAHEGEGLIVFESDYPESQLEAITGIVRKANKISPRTR